MVTVEQSEERPLSTSSTFNTSETKIIPSPLQIPQVPKQFLDPESSPLSNSRKLGRLEMSESECGEILVLLRESC